METEEKKRRNITIFLDSYRPKNEKHNYISFQFSNLFGESPAASNSSTADKLR
jgi:hypothetical protein